MENTIENKKKFFALYWGQSVAIQTEGGGSGFNYEIHANSIDDIGRDYLLLKRPYDLTIDDAIEVARLWYTETFHKGREMHKIKSLLEHRGLKNMPLGVADWFRKNGFAIPFGNLTVTDTEKYGWIKLKSE